MIRSFLLIPEQEPIERRCLTLPDTQVVPTLELSRIMLLEMPSDYLLVTGVLISLECTHEQKR